MKILLSAFACDPTMGSEPYVGWNWMKLSRSLGRVFVITRWQHKSSIEQFLASEKIEDVVFFYFDAWGFKNLDHRARGIKLYYIIWQFLVFFYVFFLHLKHRFDLVHHVTYNAMDFPGVLWILPKCKFVWGPIGGGQVPPPMAKNIYGAGWLKERLRGAMKSLAVYNPLVMLAIKLSSLVMFANEETRRRFSGVSMRRCESVLETAVLATSVSCPRQIKHGACLNLIWVGRIEARKALSIALDAIDRLLIESPGVQIRLYVVGDGPDYPKWNGFVHSHPRLSSVVNFTGILSYAAVQDLYSSMDLMLFTSVQDTSGNVVLESLSKGIPVIAINHQGAGEILKFGGGKMVQLGSYDEVVAGFSSMIAHYIDNVAGYASDSADAINVINGHFTWESKLDFVKEIYSEI